MAGNSYLPQGIKMLLGLATLKKNKKISKSPSSQAFKRVGPPNKVQEKNLIVDELRDLGYSGIYDNNTTQQQKI